MQEAEDHAEAMSAAARSAAAAEAAEAGLEQQLQQASSLAQRTQASIPIPDPDLLGLGPKEQKPSPCGLPGRTSKMATSREVRPSLRPCSLHKIVLPDISL